MKRCRCIALILAAVLLMIAAFPVSAYANAAEPPRFTVMVYNPPEDMSLSLKITCGGRSEVVELERQNKAWESYYRFYTHMSPLGRSNLDSAVLAVQGGRTSLEIPLPVECLRQYNMLLTLDLEAGSIAVGQPEMRVPLLVALRVALTLLIEGAVFFLFGYRRGRSWALFLVANLITQGALNALITGPMVGSYWVIGYFFGEVLAFVVELVAYVCLLPERGAGRAVWCAVTANLASLVLGGALIANLPV